MGAGREEVNEMDLQTILHNAVAAARAEEMKTSPQLTLGEMMLKLEAVQSKGLPVVFDIQDYHPIGIGSWRGSYNELALEYESGGATLTARGVIALLRGVVGRTLEGYKGGNYLMGKTTPIWVANYGDSMGFREEEPTAVVDILETEDEVIIETKALEY